VESGPAESVLTFEETDHGGSPAFGWLLSAVAVVFVVVVVGVVLVRRRRAR
jgi:hypothetical protein